MATFVSPWTERRSATVTVRSVAAPRAWNLLPRELKLKNIRSSTTTSPKDILIQLGIHLPLTMKCAIGLVGGAHAAVTVSVSAARHFYNDSDSGRLSLCLSVRHIPVFCPDERRYDHAFFSVIILVSGEVKFIWIFAGDHPQRGR